MARKRAALAHLDYESSEYWNRLLAGEGLSIHAGRNPKLVHVGTSNHLDIVNTAEEQRRAGRVQPKNGKRPVPGPPTSLDEVIADMETNKRIAEKIAALDAQNKRVHAKKIIPVIDAPAEEKVFIDLSMSCEKVGS